MFDVQTLFAAGQNGYARYRIPALVVSASGALLAFCEARKYSGRDSDQIDLLLRRSTDDGRTWDAPRTVASVPGWVCGNPAPVLDRTTGTLWLLFCMNRQTDDERTICRGDGPRTVWITFSDDDGATWAEPCDITASVKPADWGWYATGPGHGIQLRSGRLLIPCDHSRLNPDLRRETPYFSHVIVSDDHGRTWRCGGSTQEGSNECMALETSDGRVYLNSRNAPWSLLQRSGGVRPEEVPYQRLVAWSSDGGDSFGLSGPEPALLEPICQASLCRDAAGRVLFANPPGRTRANLTLRLSADDCRTWSAGRVLHAGPAAYSDLCVSDSGTIGCFFECGTADPYERLAFARLDYAWLEESP